MIERMSCAIVASVMPRDLAELTAAAAAAVGDADLLELRADLAGDAFANWLALLPRLPLPTIVTIRARADGGAFAGDEGERARRLVAASSVAAWIDLEANGPLADAPLGPAQRIVSHHEWRAPPHDLEAMAAALVARRRDAVVKLAITPRDLVDVARIARLQRSLAEQGARVACFAMGELGAPTRLLAGKLGAAFVYGSLAGYAATAPGQPTVTELARLHRLREQHPTMAAAAVIGDPIAHSASPTLHHALYRAAGVVRGFVPMRAPDLASALDLCDALGVTAAAITLPHKETAARSAIGALPGEPWPPFAGSANTLMRTVEGWRAGNSDVAGFRAALRHGWPSSRPPPQRALVLGAGGVARTAVVELREARVEVTVCARTFARAAALAAEFGATAVAWEQRADVARDLIVQATPLGMAPRIDETPLPATAIRADDVLFELIYRPRRTRLLEEASARGAATIEGLEMFVEQALVQHLHFTGARGDAAVARAAVIEELSHIRAKSTSNAIT